MRAVVVYESMYGNTHAIADAIGNGLRSVGEVEVMPVDEATPEELAHADLLVVGGPTHAHSMSRESTRQNAVDGAKVWGRTLADALSDGIGDRDDHTVSSS